MVSAAPRRNYRCSLHGGTSHGPLGSEGRRRGRKQKTTIPADISTRPADLVDREFVAVAPNLLWIADITYVATWSEFVYMSFIFDGFSRRIIGWRVSNTLRADLALSTPWNRRSGPDSPKTPRTSKVWSTTPTVASNTYPSDTPNGSPPRVPSPRSVRKEILTTTPWPNRSSASTRPS